MVARLVISPLVPDISGAFSVSTSEIGLALTGMWVAYALSQFPSGVLGDRFGERRIILTAVGLTAVASAALGVASSFLTLSVFVVLLGAGAGLHYTVATTLLTKHFEKVGRAIGVHVAGGPLAGVLAPIAAAGVAARFGWRTAIVLGVVAAVPVFATFLWCVRPTPPERETQPMRERFDPAAVAELLARPSIAFTTVLAVFGAFAWQATASFLPTFLIEYQGFSQPGASLLFAVYFTIHGATQPLTGWLSDTVDRDSAVALTMLIGAVGYGLLIVGSGLVTVVVAVLVVGVAMSWGAPLQSRFIDNLSRMERGAGFGLVRTVYMLLGASGSVVVGVAADTLGWAMAFGILGGVMTLGFGLLLASHTLRLDV